VSAVAALKPQQVDQFHDEGYVLVEGLLDPARDLQPVFAEYAGVLDRLAAELLAEGRIASLHDDLPFSERLTRIYAESGKVHAQYFDFSLPQANVRHDTPFWAGPAVFALLRHPAILGVVEGLIGPEIYANPVQHVRLKPPEHATPKDERTGQVQLGATPWHQDNGVVTADADETEMITVWFPLTEATVENGCLAVVPGSHRGGLLDHCPGDPMGLKVPEPLFDPGQAVPQPMRPGDALLMHRRTLHCSLPNRGRNVRWSFDLRYQPIGQPTGRAVFPGFIARSRRCPEAELHDPREWHRLWLEARAILAERAMPRLNRWSADSLVCA